MPDGDVPPLPPAREFVADPRWRAIEFVSDVHLSADEPATAAAFLATLDASDADAILILGDLFEVWVGDDARGGDFESACLSKLGRVASGRFVGFMAGNRDFLLGDAALAEAGVARLEDPTVLVAFGERWLLSHGDALCVDDVDYQRFRTEVRSARWQRDFLARPLDERRAIARALRDASQARQRSLAADAYADVDRDAALAVLDGAGAHALIHGHTHRPADEAVAPGRVRHVLADWHADASGLQRGDRLRLTARGLERIAAR